MPVGNPNKNTIRVKRYQQKIGYISKSYKLKKDVADACKECGESQASVITRLMEGYILEANQEKT